MRDHGIAYGFSDAEMNQSDLRALSPEIKSFVSQHPDLLHEESNVSWLLGQCDESFSCDGHPNNHGNENRPAHDKAGSGI